MPRPPAAALTAPGDGDGLPAAVLVPALLALAGLGLAVLAFAGARPARRLASPPAHGRNAKGDDEEIGQGEVHDPDSPSRPE